MKPLKAENEEEELDSSVEDRDAVKRWASRLRPVPTSEPRQGHEPVRPERPRTVKETAEELGLSVHTIRAWIADRRLAHLRLGRAIRIPAAEIRRVIEKSTVPAVKEE
jgi:excisionase family DNA binding protein